MDKHLETVAFGGGCFWCTEAVFKMIKGVESVLPGYAGGHTENPTYEEVSTKDTGHAEVVYLKYDSATVRFRDLLTVFFASHDGTQLNRQGNDVGTQYRSIILYQTHEQKTESEQFIEELNQSASDGEPVVTEVKPLTTFYEAEPEHLDYYRRNQSAGYCQVIIAPKLAKVQKEYAKLLKTL